MVSVMGLFGSEHTSFNFILKSSLPFKTACLANYKEGALKDDCAADSGPTSPLSFPELIVVFFRFLDHSLKNFCPLVFFLEPKPQPYLVLCYHDQEVISVS